MFKNSTLPNRRPKAGQFFFAQVGCTSVDGNGGDYMRNKRLLGLFTATIGVFMCIYFSLTM